MPTDPNQLLKQVENLNQQFLFQGGNADLERQCKEAFELLEEVFYNSSLGDLDDLFDSSIILASHVRNLTGSPQMPNIQAQKAIAMLISNPQLRNDPSEYINQLCKCSLVALTLGDLVTYAYCLDSMGLAYLDIQNFDQAWICFQKQVKIYNKLKLKDELPRAYLHLAYAAKYLAMGGRLIWQSASELFEKCAQSLNAADLDSKAHDEILAAYFIDRVPAIIEVAKEKNITGIPDKNAVLKAVSDARQSLREGRKLANKHHDLSRYLTMADNFEANVELIALEHK